MSLFRSRAAAPLPRLDTVAGGSSTGPVDVSPRTIWVGRQAIVTRTLDVVGYEILFRHEAIAHAEITDGAQATAQVLLNTFLGIGLEPLVGSKRAFLNLPREILLEDCLHVLPAEQVVLEILEDVSVDPALLTAVQQLGAQGYTIALDDFQYQDALRPLLQLAHIVKLDVRALDRTALQETVARLRAYPVQLLAEKVETYEEFSWCVALGFDYFQGYFFCKPDLVQGQRHPANRLTLLQLLAALHNPQLDFVTLEALISQDAVLSYNLLRLINSAFFGLAHKVASLRKALHLLGLNAVRAWVSLLLLERVEGKPHELLTLAMLRARMCAQLAHLCQEASEERLFLVGLFSLLDALLDCPLSAALGELPLDETVRQALLHHEGSLGATLQSVIAYERGSWEEVAALGIPPTALRPAYVEALAWTTRLRQMAA